MIERLGNRAAAGTQSRGARVVLLSLLLPFLAPYALALDPDRSIKQFFHTGWTAAEGAPNGIETIAQTSDDYLLLGTVRGRVRFDGVRFEDDQPPKGGKIPSDRITSMLATPHGGLWIGFRTGGASFLAGGRVVNYGEPEWGFSRDYLCHIFLESQGTLWASTQRGVFCLPPNGRRFQVKATLKSGRFSQTPGRDSREVRLSKLTKDRLSTDPSPFTTNHSDKKRAALSQCRNRVGSGRSE
jgi:ligand-binding sensor domain-containing protein